MNTGGGLGPRNTTATSTRMNVSTRHGRTNVRHSGTHLSSPRHPSVTLHPLQEQKNIEQGISNTEGNGLRCQDRSPVDDQKESVRVSTGLCVFSRLSCGNSPVSSFNIRHSLLDILRFQTGC